MAEYLEKGEISPAFSKDYIAIVLVSSDEYADYLLVTLASIKFNASRQKNYDIVVLSDEIKEKKRVVIFNEVECDNICIRFLDVSHALDGVALRTESHVTKSTYLRILSLDIMRAYSKFIYLDCDTVVNCDIAQLFDIDIDEYMVAAVMDSIMCGWCYMNDDNGIMQKHYLLDELGIIDPRLYFNAGVMLINLEAFKEKALTSVELIGIAAKKEWRWFDQDVLNLCTGGKVKYLGPEWNVEVHGYWKEQEISEFYMPKELYEEYKKAIETPKIVHYAGNSNPIKEPTVDKCDLFWKYSRMTSAFPRLHSEMLREQGRRAAACGLSKNDKLPKTYIHYHNCWGRMTKWLKQIVK